MSEGRPGEDIGGVEDVPMADTPMYLSHHWPWDYDRCVTVAGLHICRRCIVLYPVALVSGIAVSVGSWWPSSLDPFVLWILPLPGVIEFVLDNMRIIGHLPARQVAFTAMGGFAAGVGYTRYLDDTFDPLVWSVVGAYTAICLIGAIIGGLRRGRRAG